MTAAAELRSRLAAALGDPEIERLSPGLALRLRLNIAGTIIQISIAEGETHIDDDGTRGDAVEVRADDVAWAKLLETPPPPRFHSFTALQLANPDFSIAGDPLVIARARPVLERLFELLVASPVAPAATVVRDHRQVNGRYDMVVSQGVEHLVYNERAGADGATVLFLHTAGADGRQYLAQMTDVALAHRYRLINLDLPFHGRSMPPTGWDGAPYRLNKERYRDWISAFIEQVIGEPTILVGGSMGAAIALVMAAEQPHLTAGIVALEPPFRSPGRRNPYQNHVAVHAGLHNGAFVRGLMGPTSPIDSRRRASWIYAQGAPGVYPGDLAFYSEEFDGATVAPKIDAARTPVALLSGTYDYSATPDDGARLAALIPGALHLVMDGLGHFPATEHPDLFRPWLLRGLEHIG